jgi:hypothetical protein
MPNARTDCYTVRETRPGQSTRTGFTGEWGAGRAPDRYAAEGEREETRPRQNMEESKKEGGDASVLLAGSRQQQLCISCLQRGGQRLPRGPQGYRALFWVSRGQ